MKHSRNLVTQTLTSLSLMASFLPDTCILAFIVLQHYPQNSSGAVSPVCFCTYIFLLMGGLTCILMYRKHLCHPGSRVCALISLGCPIKCHLNHNGFSWLPHWKVIATQSCPVAHQAPLSLGFSRQERWSGWPSPSPGGSSHPRDWTSCIGPPALQADPLKYEWQGIPYFPSDLLKLLSHCLLYSRMVQEETACARCLGYLGYWRTTKEAVSGVNEKMLDWD